MAGEVARVTMVFLHGAGFGSRMTSGFHAEYQPAGDPLGSVVAELADVTAEWWATNTPGTNPGADFFGTHIMLDHVEAQVIAPTEGVTYVTTSGVPGNVTETGDELTLSDSVLASIRTPLGGRSYRGRMYLPQPPNGQVSAAGILDSTYGGDLRACLDELRTNIEAITAGADWQFGVYSKTLATFTQATDVLVAREVADQRRRELRNQGYFSVA